MTTKEENKSGKIGVVLRSATGYALIYERFALEQHVSSSSWVLY